MLDTGFRPAEIALDLGVARQTAYEWKAVFDAQGLAGAKAKPHPGPGKNITTEQLEEFKTMILQGALVHGFPSNNWTCARAAALIETTFGLTYTADHVGAMMKELGLSPQKLATFTTTNASAAAKKLEIPVQYSCPSDLAAYDSGYGYIDICTYLPIVHSTGLTDDFGTPKDPNDDQPQLELAYVYFIVHCQLPPGPRLSITEDPELIVVAAGNPFTAHFDLANTGEGTLTYRVDGTGRLNDLKLGSIGSNQTTRLYLSGTCPNEGDITRSRSAIATISSNAPLLNNSGGLGFNVYCFPPDPVPFFLEPFYGYL